MLTVNENITKGAEMALAAASLWRAAATVVSRGIVKTPHGGLVSR